MSKSPASVKCQVSSRDSPGAKTIAFGSSGIAIPGISAISSAWDCCVASSPSVMSNMLADPFFQDGSGLKRLTGPATSFRRRRWQSNTDHDRRDRRHLPPLAHMAEALRLAAQGFTEGMAAFPWVAGRPPRRDRADRTRQAGRDVPQPGQHPHQDHDPLSPKWPTSPASPQASSGSLPGRVDLAAVGDRKNRVMAPHWPVSDFT